MQNEPNLRDTGHQRRATTKKGDLFCKNEPNLQDTLMLVNKALSNNYSGKYPASRQNNKPDLNPIVPLHERLPMAMAALDDMEQQDKGADM